MNSIIEQRIKQLISVKFLKKEEEIIAIGLLLGSIERDFEKNHGKSIINSQQIQTRQIYTLNKIQDSFSCGSDFFIFLKSQTNGSFATLKTHDLIKMVTLINNVTASQIIETINKYNKPTKIKQVFKGKKNYPKKEVNVSIKNK